MQLKVILPILCIVVISSCKLFRPTIVQKEYDTIPTTKNQNICKQLKDSIIVYALFVDVDCYHPWTEFDVNSTVDSLNRAMSWLETEAFTCGHQLSITPIMHENGSKKTIRESLAKAKLSANVVSSLNIHSSKTKTLNWADAIAKYAGKTIKKPNTSKLASSIKISNVQTLNQVLRDLYNSENVAILYFVNGYYENHPSYSFNTSSNGRAEYSIITSKNPAIIAHEVLHLFGAVDLYPNYQFPNFNFKELGERYPNEIMRVQHKDLNKLTISPITSYFVGWQDTLDHSNTRLLLHKYNLTDY